MLFRTWAWLGAPQVRQIRYCRGILGFLVARGGMTALEREVAGFIQSEYKPVAA
jgi:hypothetical protein